MRSLGTIFLTVKGQYNFWSWLLVATNFVHSLIQCSKLVCSGFCTIMIDLSLTSDTIKFECIRILKVIFHSFNVNWFYDLGEIVKIWFYSSSIFIFKFFLFFFSVSTSCVLFFIHTFQPARSVQENTKKWQGTPYPSLKVTNLDIRFFNDKGQLDSEWIYDSSFLPKSQPKITEISALEVY